MKKRKFKSIQGKGFTISQDNFEDWLKVLRRNLGEMEMLIRETKKILGAVTEFIRENKLLMETGYKKDHQEFLRQVKERDEQIRERLKNSESKD